MSTATRDGHVIRWPTTPRRTWRQRLTAWRDQTFGPDPAGATDGWLTQMRTDASQLDDDTTAPAAVEDDDKPSTGRHRVDNSPTTLLARPVAIAAVPYRLIDVPGLGVLPIGPLEPAHIHDQLIGAER